MPGFPGRPHPIIAIALCAWIAPSQAWSQSTEPAPAAPIAPSQEQPVAPAPVVETKPADPAPASTPPVVEPPPPAAPEPATTVNPALPPPKPMPRPEHVIGKYDAYRPFVTYLPKGMFIQVHGHLALRMEGVSDFALDRYNTQFQSGVALSPMFRIGGRFSTMRALRVLQIAIEAELDAPTGTWQSGTPPAGEGLPNSAPIDLLARKAYARISVGPYLHLGGGFMTNEWGLGMVANGGSTQWQPGSARFIDNRGGDVVLRGFVGTGPLSNAGVSALFAVDKLWRDDVLLPGDSGIQVIGSASVGTGGPRTLGVFVVHRRQDSAGGAFLHATAIDLAGKWVARRKGVIYALELEAALVTGRTSLAPTPEHPEHEILQFGATLRGTVAGQKTGAVIDLVIASGDENPDDDKQTAFKADPNFETGLLLYRYVAAAQSGRAVATAGDPTLVGKPAPDLERFATRGGLSNTVVFFPRIYYRPLSGIEIYGGPLLAWAAVKNIDPLNSRVAGGSLRNALDGTPGGYLATEVDVGARYRAILAGSELTLGIEAGVLMPGAALSDVNGVAPDATWGGRLMASYRL